MGAILRTSYLSLSSLKGEEGDSFFDSSTVPSLVETCESATCSVACSCFLCEAADLYPKYYKAKSKHVNVKKTMKYTENLKD